MEKNQLTRDALRDYSQRFQVLTYYALCGLIICTLFIAFDYESQADTRGDGAMIETWAMAPFIWGLRLSLVGTVILWSAKKACEESAEMYVWSTDAVTACRQTTWCCTAFAAGALTCGALAVWFAPTFFVMLCIILTTWLLCCAVIQHHAKSAMRSSATQGYTT